MTGFETWLLDNGGILVNGDTTEFSTYKHVQRTYLYGNLQRPIQVGLMSVEGNNKICLRFPIVTHLPTDNFQEFVDNLPMLSTITAQYIIEQ